MLTRSLNGALISKSSTSKKILNVLSWEIKKPSDVEETSVPSSEMDQDQTLNLFAKTSVKKGSAPKVVGSDDHVIDI